MLKSLELQERLLEVKNSAKELTVAKEINAKVTEMEDINAQIVLALMEEADEKAEVERQFEIQNKTKKDGVKVENNVEYNKDFVNLLKGEITHKDFKNTLKEGVPADGGVIVPVAHDYSINVLREAEEALQTLVRVIPVTTLSGSKKLQERKGSGTNFKLTGEGQPILDGGTPQFRSIDWAVAKYTAMYDITNEELDDTDAKIISMMNSWIGNDSRSLRNQLILTVLNTLPKTVVTDEDSIKAILNVQLSTVAKKYAKIVTNQSGYNHLDTLKDGTGNSLLQPDATRPSGYVFKGVPVHVYDNDTIPNVTVDLLTKAPIIIGDLQSVLLFDRKAVEIKVTDIGSDAFDNDITKMRAIERGQVRLFGEVADLARDIVYGQVTIV